MTYIRKLQGAKVAIIALCIIQLNAGSVVNVSYSTPGSSIAHSEEKKVISAGLLELHLDGTVVVDYRVSKNNKGQHVAQFLLKDITFSDQLQKDLQAVIARNQDQAKQLGYSIDFVFLPKEKGGDKVGGLLTKLVYDPQLIAIEYFIDDTKSGREYLKIILQNKKVLQKLDSNHHPILRFARDMDQKSVYLYC